MLQFLAWYLLLSFLGWLTFPLAYRLFPALADRGFSLARTLAMLVWGYVFWMLASLGLIQNDPAGLLLALLVLAAVSGSGLLQKERRAAWVDWIRSNRRVILTTEVLFLLAFAAWAFVRASNPNIETAGGEKTMELAFINAILRSPTFPPHDPWLSGYAISYYYFGYVMAAMLAKLTGTLGGVAHNLMTSLIFALSFIGAYGILYNLLAAWRKHHPAPDRRAPSTGLPLLGPLFLLFVSNLEGFLEVLHSKGLFWKFNPDGSATSAFWKWVGIKNLVDPPSQPLVWTPHRFIWWWQSSRVLQDYDFAGGFREIIDEFPAFSFLLGDLHPHVLALPFGLMAAAVALNLFLGGWKGETDLRFYKLPVRLEGLIFGALILGGLAFLNTWDILMGFALVAGAFVLARVMEEGWSWRRLEDLFAFSIPTGLLAILFYLPFYIGFQSQAGGILPNLDSPTRGTYIWIMFAPMLLALLAYFIYSWRVEKQPANWKLGFGVAAILVALLALLTTAMTALALGLRSNVAEAFVGMFCSGSIGNCLADIFQRRLMYIGGLLTLFVVLGGALTFVVRIQPTPGEQPAQTPEKGKKADRSRATTAPVSYFILMLVMLGSVLVLAPEFVFLRDLFTNRMNTVFKFYYQAWLLWSLAAAFGVAVLLQELKGGWGWIYRVGLALVLIVSLAFPVFGLPNKTNDFQIPAFLQSLKDRKDAGDPNALQDAARVWTLDGTVLFSNQFPDDAAAARWLLTAPPGVIVEAFNKSSSYTDFARMSAYSGQPSVLGWWYHEWQWRGTLDQLASPITNLDCKDPNSYDSRRMRSDDISCLYETKSWDVVNEVINQYHIRYVVVGTLERQIYHLNEKLFQDHLTQVFQQGAVTIYEVPSGTEIP